MPVDLNIKKSWHPGRLKNQAIIAKKEQDALDERKKILEYQKEVQLERERNDLRDLQDQVTGRDTNKNNRNLEWMYGSSGIGQASLNIDSKDDYLLGKKRMDDGGLVKDEPVHQPGLNIFEQALEASSFSSADTNVKDLNKKMLADPMAAIKQKQMEQARLARKREFAKRQEVAEAQETDYNGRDRVRDRDTSHSTYSNSREERNYRDKSERGYYSRYGGDRYRERERDQSSRHDNDRYRERGRHQSPRYSDDRYREREREQPSRHNNDRYRERERGQPSRHNHNRYHERERDQHQRKSSDRQQLLAEMRQNAQDLAEVRSSRISAAKTQEQEQDSDKPNVGMATLAVHKQVLEGPEERLRKRY